MSDKIDLLKTLGFSDELLKYFQEQSEEQKAIVVEEIDPINFESFDVADISNISQVELASTVFTFNPLQQ